MALALLLVVSAVAWIGHPWSREQCLSSAAKLPTTSGVDIAKTVCADKFPANPPVNLERANRVAGMWEDLSRSGQPATASSYAQFMGEPDVVYGPHKCMNPLDASRITGLPKVGWEKDAETRILCYTHMWVDGRSGRSSTMHFRIEVRTDREKTVWMAWPDSLESTILGAL